MRIAGVVQVLLVDCEVSIKIHDVVVDYESIQAGRRCCQSVLVLELLAGAGTTVLFILHCPPLPVVLTFHMMCSGVRKVRAHNGFLTQSIAKITRPRGYM